MRLGLLALALLSLAGMAGCITTPGSEMGVTATAREKKLAPCKDGLIEDAEDKNTRILQTDGRGGYWFSFVDAAGSTVNPAQGAFTMSDGGADGSAAAARVTGKMAPSGSSVYAGMGFKLLDGPGTYDASAYRGISFKARGPGRVRFEVPDANTAPEGGFCTDCYNDFGIHLYFTDQWETYTIEFPDLSQQRGWGDRRPEIDASQLIAIEWQFGSPGREFDIAIDDVQFVGCE